MKKHKPSEEVPEDQLSTRLRQLKTEWNKAQNAHTRNGEKFSMLKNYIYFLIKVDNVPQARVADYIGVTPQRITTILNEISTEKGETI